MAQRSVVTYGNPSLKQRASEIKEIDDSVKKLAAEMFEALERSRGVGLAAPQVGVPLRLIVLSIPMDDGARWKCAIVNPVLVSKKGKMTSEEGCLSVPGIYEEITRAEEVEVRGLDLEGKEVKIKGKGLLAKAVQHEIDHIDGILIVDRLSAIKRHVLHRRLRKLEESSKGSRA